MKASEAKKLAEYSKKGNKLQKILRQIQKQAELGLYNEVDYISKDDIQSLIELGYNVEVHSETSMAFGNGNNMCTISWYESPH